MMKIISYAKHSIVIAAILLSTEDAYMTQINFQNIPLEQLVKMSEYVLIVNKGKPFIVEEKISILPGDSNFLDNNNPPYYEPPYHDREPAKDQKNKNYPPYGRQLFRFQITEILFSSNPELAVNAEIVVSEAHGDRKLRLHKAFYLEGARISPIYVSYESSLNHAIYGGADKVIIFLSHHDDRFYFICENAYESVRKRKKIIKLINDLKAR